MSKRKGKCIFCDSEKSLSKEHIFPNWLNQYFPREGGESHHLVKNPGGNIREGKLERPGSIFSQRLRIVCIDCNSGWMSRLQNEAKPYLLPLINGDWGKGSEEGFATISRWITMFTMVGEHSHPESCVVPLQERHSFQSKNTIPEGWIVWIGRINQRGQEPARFNHFGGHLRYSPEAAPFAYAQSTGVAIGEFYFQTFSSDSPPEIFTEAISFYEQNVDAQRIYPSTNNVTKPKSLYSSDDFGVISSLIAKKMGSPSFRSVTHHDGSKTIVEDKVPPPSYLGGRFRIKK